MAPAAVISLGARRRVGPALRLLGDRRLGRLTSKGDARVFAASTSATTRTKANPL